MKIYGDHLKRSQVVNDIVSIVSSCVELEHPITFSLEGEWGKGKTWIVEKVASILSGVDLSKKELSYLNRDGDKDYMVFSYNAWEKDYYNEPLFAILITIINQLNKELLLENVIRAELKALYKESKEILENSLRALSTKLIGIDVVDFGKHALNMARDIRDDAQIITNVEYTDSNVEKDIDTVVKTLNKMAKSRPIVFVVDELDRCLPEYSIKTLERLHHIFGKVQSSVTIISINEKQLKNSVEKMFGSSISFESYLRKFVDFRITIDSGEADGEEIQRTLKPYLDLFGEWKNDEIQVEILSNLYGNMTAREFEKVYNNAFLCHKLVGRDTVAFPKECAVGEILLFSNKIALEKESNPANLSPLYGNEASSKLGKYIKNFVKKLHRNSQYILNDSTNIVLYIYAKGMNLIDEMNISFSSIPPWAIEADTFYDVYSRYYRLMK